jgi:hypothetical protein
MGRVKKKYEDIRDLGVKQAPSMYYRGRNARVLLETGF